MAIDQHCHKTCTEKETKTLKAKRSGNDEDWPQFRQFRRTLERRIRKKHRDNVSDFIGASLETNNSKPFWNYVKASNLTSFGITSLTKKTGEVVFTPEEKARILNEQFQSVFTEENADRMPDLRTTTTLTLPPLVVSNAGVRRLLVRTGFKPAYWISVLRESHQRYAGCFKLLLTLDIYPMTGARQILLRSIRKAIAQIQATIDLFR